MLKNHRIQVWMFSDGTPEEYVGAFLDPDGPHYEIACQDGRMVRIRKTDVARIVDNPPESPGDPVPSAPGLSDEE